VTPAGRRSLGLNDAIAATALLLVALIPFYVGSFRSEIAADPGRLLWEIENRRALARGILPLWDPFQFGGRPHLADASTHVFYPPYLVARLFPLELFFVVNLVLHTWLAGIGAYLVARHLKMTRVASLAGSAAVMFAVAPAGDVANASSLFTLACIPLAIAFAMRTTDRPHLLPHPGLVLVVVMALMTGSVRGVLYVLAAIVGAFLFAELWPSAAAFSPRRRLAQLALLACLAIGLTAVQSVPFMRFRMSAPRPAVLSGGMRHEAGRQPTEERDGLSAERIVAALGPMRRGRAISTCGHAMDRALVAQGVPIIGGAGGVLPADYARFTNLARGLYPARDVYTGMHEPGSPPARADLLRLLDAQYLVSCEAPDPARWVPVSRIEGMGIYRNVNAADRAVWTCAPRLVGPLELEYRLRRQRYDSTLTLRDTGPVIHVRWAERISEADRSRAEREFQLVPERFLGQRTWQYELLDTSSSNIADIVTSELVEDTAGLERSRFAVVPPMAPTFDEEPKSEWLIGVDPCPDTRRATVLVQDREDGRLVVVVDAPRDGLLFLSETYSTERAAWVDGRRVESLRVNLAFTGIRMSQGQHRVELKYDARPFWLGAGVSALTLVLWSVGASRSRRGAQVSEQRVVVSQN